jgi:predicted transcriptional regulator
MARLGSGTDAARVEERRVKVADLYVRGFPQGRIAEMVGVSQTQISFDLAAVKERWVAEQLVDFGERVSRELDKIDRVEEEAWAAWERSKKAAKTRSDKTESMVPKADEDEPEPRGKGKGKRKPAKPTPSGLIPVKQIRDLKITYRDGNPAFLERVAWCIETRLKLLGQLKETTTVNVVQFDWDSLTGRPERTADEVEERIRRAALPAPSED